MTRISKGFPRPSTRRCLALALAGSALCTPGFAQTPSHPDKAPAVASPTAPAADKPAAAPAAGSADAGREAAQSGAAKTDAAKTDAAKTDAAKTGAAKTDAHEADAAKVDDDPAAAGTQSPGDDRQGPQQARQARQQDREAFFDAHLAALHAGLTLTGEQEALWAPVETAIRALEKTRRPRRTRQEIAGLLDESPSDMLRMRGEQLTRRGDAMRQLAEAASPLVDKLDEAQKRRLPYLLEGMRPGAILRAAFDIRYGRVEEDARQGRRGDDGASAGDGYDDRGRGDGDAMRDDGPRGRFRQQGLGDEGPMGRPPERYGRERFDMDEDRT